MSAEILVIDQLQAIQQKSKASLPRYGHIQVVEAMLEVNGGIFGIRLPFIELMG